MNENASQVSALVTNAIPELLSFLADGRVANNRIRFTGVGGQSFNNFLWMMLDRYESESEGVKIWAHTNDMDLMVGYPPSFTMSVAIADYQSLVEPIVRFLTEKLASYQVVEVLVKTDANPGETAFPAYTGDSESGWSNIKAQTETDTTNL
ncbi:MAG: hypothetical protein K8F91_03880 [Candidatus Obscuribacterales bacterium]|nr:hypothetical protein [Candidatus Obscuribacterales bacterium]